MADRGGGLDDLAPPAPGDAVEATAPAPAEARRLVLARARALGFDVVGVASAEAPLEADFARYTRFLEAGMHGSMAFLAEDIEARRAANGPAILEGARSVICLGRRYDRAALERASDPPFARGLAAYARGQDYHVFLRKRARRLAAYVRTLGSGVSARPLCDVEPLLERAWAARAGLGFVGKNGLVIAPGQGSFMLLAEVVTTLPLTPDVPMAERCGACALCLEACPTQAFTAPYVLDARRCIAYLTIEAEEDPAPALRPSLGERLFGCDVCQDVCPYNRVAPPAPERTVQFRPHPRWEGTRLADIVRLTPEGFARLVEGSPLHRAGREGLVRSAVLVARNRAGASAADAEAHEALDVARHHDDSWVRRLALDEAPA